MAQMSKSIYETRVQREAVESETAATIANEGRKPLEVQIEIFEHHPSSLQEKCKALEVYVSKVKDKKPAVLWTRCEAETKSPGTKVVFEAECRNKYAQESQVAELQHELQRNKSEQNNMHRDDMQRSKEYEKMLTERERAVAVRKEQEENFLKRLRRVGEAQESIIKTAAVNFDAGSEALKKTENAGKKAEQLTAAEAARTGLIKEQDEKAAAKKVRFSSRTDISFQ
jgi:nicotinamide mononucleotide adenylyltransferase